MGRIRIQEISEFNNIIHKEYPVNQAGALLSEQFYLLPGSMKTFFTYRATEDVLQEIDWGKATYRNTREQGGILVGHFCNAAENGKQPEIWVEVCRAIPCRKPKVSRSDYLYMSADNWRDMYQELDRMNLEEHTDYVLVGWYHTHPRNIPAAFSNLDVETQSGNFGYEYSIGAVFNPHRKVWTVYYGPECREGRGCLLLTKEENVPREEHGVMIPQEEHIPAGDREDREEEKKVLLQYDWIDLLRNSVFGSSYRKAQREPSASQQLITDICAVCDWMACGLHFSQEADCGQEENSRKVGLAIAEVTGDLDAYQSLSISKCYYYKDIRDLSRHYDDVRGNRLGILLYQSGVPVMEEESWILSTMSDFSLSYLVLYDLEAGGDRGYCLKVYVKNRG